MCCVNTICFLFLFLHSFALSPVAADDPQIYTCPLNHTLNETICADPSLSCSFCMEHLYTDEHDAATLCYRCDHICDYILCEACYSACAQAGIPVSPPLTEETSDEDMPANPCGLTKDLPPATYRRFGGVATGMLACGLVANIMPVAGCESATQITGMAGEVRARRQLRYIVYDNACMLAHFVRNRAAGKDLATLHDLALMKFVIDRWHKRNHTACLNPEHVMYTPEVDIEQYEDLKPLNSSQNEQWNAWLDCFVPGIRHMHPDSFTLYILLLADLWNTYIVARSPRQVICQCSDKSLNRQLKTIQKITKSNKNW